MKIGDYLIGDLPAFLFDIRLLLFLFIGECEHAGVFALLGEILPDGTLQEGFLMFLGGVVLDVDQLVELLLVQVGG